MKQGIHPEYVTTTVTCTCGNTFETRSTATDGKISADVCSACTTPSRGLPSTAVSAAWPRCSPKSCA